MKKLTKLLILVLFILLPIKIDATSNLTIKDEYYNNVKLAKKVYDYASILSDKTEANLQNEAEELYDKYKIDFVVMTTDLETNETTRKTAKDFYDDNNFGYGSDVSGMILVIDIYHREYYIFTSGNTVDVISNNRLNKIQNAMDKDISSGNYDDAVMTYAKQTKKYYFYHKYGPPYLWIGAVAIAAIIAYLEVKREKNKLKLISDDLDASFYYDDEHIDFKNETLINTRHRTVTNQSSKNSNSMSGANSKNRKQGGSGRHF